MSNQAYEEKVKIGGWLIVVGVLLWLGVLSDFLNFLLRILVNTTHYPTAPGSLVNEVINFVILVPMLVMFHRRKATLVWWSIIFGIYAVIDECFIQYRQIITHAPTTLVGHVIAVVLETLFMAGIVMYFFKSKRVKRTFVR
jgi:hypothetical protein